MTNMLYAGQPVLRFEDDRLLRGKGAYVADLECADALHAAIVRSPHAHAKIVAVDVTAATAMLGVVTVLTARDLPETVRPIPGGSRPGLEIKPGGEHPVLAVERVLYVGQPVAVVVAETLAQATDAAILVKIDYEPLGVVSDLEDAAQDANPAVHSSMGSNVGASAHVVGGDIGAAFRSCYRVVSGSFKLPRISPMPMECRGVLASYDAVSNELTFRSSNQSPHDIKEHLKEVLNIPAEIHVVTPDIGGGFGQKHNLYPEDAAVAYLAYKLRRPVRWIERRGENIHALHARGVEAHLDVAVGRTGRILGIKGRFIVDLGAFWLGGTFTSPDNTFKRVTGPYDITAYEAELFGVVTNRPPMGAYRGAGQPEATYCMERMMDLVARELGLDPVETRRQNLIAPAQFPYTTAAGIPYVDGDYEPVLDKALHVAGYDALKEARALARAEGRLVGIGIGLSTKGSGGTRGEAGRSSAVRIIALPDGRLRAYTDIVAIGQGMETSFRQIVADVVGVTPADVEILQGDTRDLTPVGSGSGTYASRGLVIGGNAMHHVAGQLQEALRGVASKMLECPAGDLEFANGKVSSRSDPSRSIGLGRLAAVAGDGEGGFIHDGAYTLPPGSFAFAAHVAMIEVDRDTGRVSIKKYVAVHDCGREINPMIVKGQIHGGLVQGLSQALFEEVAYDTEGRPAAWSLMDYTLPLAEDIPELTVETFATTAHNGPLGVRGIGEMAAVASPAAVSNAIHDALRLTDDAEIDLPLTQERIWRELQRRAVP